jgi:histidine ammonia-lyase
MPQVHGAVRGALDHVSEVIEIESGSATDNPLVFADDDDIVSGGNFHGAPLALALDYAALAVTDLISVMERRIKRLVNPDLSDGLPPFLTESPGVSSGFMIAQVTAAALLNEARVLAHPASVDNVPTSAGQEDHVSMGMTSANKLRAIVEHAERVLAIELLASAQGLDLRGDSAESPEVRLGLAAVRAVASRVTADRALGGDIERLAAALGTERFDRWSAGAPLDGEWA